MLCRHSFLQTDLFCLCLCNSSLQGLWPAPHCCSCSYRFPIANTLTLSCRVFFWARVSAGTADVSTRILLCGSLLPSVLLLSLYLWCQAASTKDALLIVVAAKCWKFGSHTLRCQTKIGYVWKCKVSILIPWQCSSISVVLKGCWKP